LFAIAVIASRTTLSNCAIAWDLQQAVGGFERNERTNISDGECFQDQIRDRIRM